MSLTAAQKKSFRSIGHHLNPVVLVSENGLSDGAMAEIDRALFDHELIKVKIAIPDRDARKALLSEISMGTRSEVVQTIGKMVLLYRKNPKAKPKLSNVARHTS
ncbi:ribosome assembly RNA-binding protein YhbY [Larsenimonas salina]|uniref:ribosome assembly RNA-binding protein YhbY n=1 Tax=Larsenimonas salina TaxID=1295565 RepID=UPI00207378FC|nr:ribosome assembly RNA-binding protein YhbY [Larsenimonas salina]MCM5705295.1 ribosome assembly RNA-binding protein YhbY [Larsenimonas salina]